MQLPYDDSEKREQKEKRRTPKVAVVSDVQAGDKLRRDEPLLRLGIRLLKLQSNLQSTLCKNMLF